MPDPSPLPTRVGWASSPVNQQRRQFGPRPKLRSAHGLAKTPTPPRQPIASDLRVGRPGVIGANLNVEHGPLAREPDSPGGRANVARRFNAFMPAPR